MDKRIAGLLGAAAALTTMTAAQRAVAEPAPSAPTLSYRDLLEPMHDALAALKADDARLAEESRAKVQVAQYYHHHHIIITIITTVISGHRRAAICIITTTIITITITTAASAYTFAKVGHR